MNRPLAIIPTIIVYELLKMNDYTSTFIRLGLRGLHICDPSMQIYARSRCNRTKHTRWADERMNGWTRNEERTPSVIRRDILTWPLYALCLYLYVYIHMCTSMHRPLFVIVAIIIMFLRSVCSLGPTLNSITTICTSNPEPMSKNYLARQ